MAKNAYLIASDLHLSYKNLRSRQDYFAETDFVKGKLAETALKYREREYTVHLLLLGDVFHNSYNSIFRACIDTNFFTVWNYTFGQIYSLIGNHELTYYSSNPFYTLINNVPSQKVQAIMNRVWKPMGPADIIVIPDILEDGEVLFHFNHNSCSIDRPEKDSRKHIGLFHHSMVTQDILSCMERELGKRIFETPIEIEGIGVLDGYDYCFFGHMHMVYGVFQTEGSTILCYLASLGRTNVNEVDDNFLERNIPAVLVEDGSLIGVEENIFSLPERSRCVKEQEVMSNRRKYEVQKACREVKGYALVQDNPVANVEEMLSGCPAALQIFRGMLDNETNTDARKILNLCHLHCNSQIF